MLVYSDIQTIALDHCASLGCSACHGVASEIKRELQRLSRIKRYSAGEVIVGEQEEIPFVGNVVSGVLRMQMTMLDGRQQIVGLLMPSDMFGRVFASVSHVSIEAATPVTLCCYNRASFEGLLARFPELEHKLLISIQDELRAAQDCIILLGCQSVMERIATFLLIVRRRSPASSRSASGTADVVTVPISRRDMAAYLGTTVESISRSIQEMARDGVLRIIDPQHLEILDERRLLLLSGRGEAEPDMPPADRQLRIA